LQKIENHKNDCGRIGVNGGYIANPNVRFGVNCFGKKPRITAEEREMMDSATPYPETKEDKLFQQKVNYYRTKIDQILVSPFSYDSWGRI
jgi:hypothetical protein